MGKIVHDSCKNLLFVKNQGLFYLTNRRAVTIMRTYNFKMGESSHDTDF